MKAHLTKVSLALLSTVFLFGCQNLGSGPVGPVGPQFDMRDAETETSCGLLVGKVFRNSHCHDGEEPTPAATYSITHSGDHFTTDDPITGTPGSGKPGTSVSFGNVHSRETIILSELFVAQLAGFGNIDKCFPKTGGIRAFGVRGGLRAGKGNIVTGLYTFLAFGTNGTTTVWYSLEPTATFVTSTSGAAFAPDPGEATTVTWDGGLLHSEGEVTGTTACVGGGGKHSAQKNVEINGSVEIVGDPVP